MLIFACLRSSVSQYEPSQLHMNTNECVAGLKPFRGQHTDEVVMLCEAAGYDTVLIETVGVGQSEILVNEVNTETDRGFHRKY